MLKRFLSYYRPHIKLFLCDMGAALLVAMIGMLYPVITRTMIGTLIPQRQYRLIVISGVCLLALYFIRKSAKQQH